MANVGTYTEKLPSGGELRVSKDNWVIYYYFPGPDLRYNGDIVEINGSQVAQFIEAFQRELA